MQTFGSSDNILNTNVTTENKIVKTGRTKALGVVLNTTGTEGDFHLKDGGASGSDLCVAFTTEHVLVCSVFYT